MIYERLLRPLLYLVTRGDPERAHDLSLSFLGWLGNRPLLNATVWRWYGSLWSRTPVVIYFLLMAAAVICGWWTMGWMLDWLPSPWAGISQTVLGIWLYWLSWYVIAIRWDVNKHRMGM